MALVAAGSAIQFVVVGGATVGVFLNALVQAEGWPHATLSAGIGVGVVCAGLATPLVGLLVDRFGVRVPIALGAACLGAGFSVLVAMRAPWHFVAANVLLGPGFAAAAMLPVTIAITLRVPARTALALGVVAVGAGAGALVLAPALQALVEPRGWRTTYAVRSTAVASVPLLLLPALPRGRLRRPAASGAPAAALPPPLLRRELRGPGVLPLAALLVIPGLVNFGLTVHLVPYLAGIGHDARVAAAALPLLALFLALHGVALGTQVAVTPVLAAQVLGRERFATRYGVLQLGATVAIGLAPVVPGLLVDAVGGYAPALGFWMETMAVGAIVAFAMPAPATRPAPLARGAAAPPLG